MPCELPAVGSLRHIPRQVGLARAPRLASTAGDPHSCPCVHPRTRPFTHDAASRRAVTPRNVCRRGVPASQAVVPQGLRRLAGLARVPPIEPTAAHDESVDVIPSSPRDLTSCLLPRLTHLEPSPASQVALRLLYEHGSRREPNRRLPWPPVSHRRISSLRRVAASLRWRLQERIVHKLNSFAHSRAAPHPNPSTPLRAITLASSLPRCAVLHASHGCVTARQARRVHPSHHARPRARRGHRAPRAPLPRRPRPPRATRPEPLRTMRRCDTAPRDATHASHRCIMHVACFGTGYGPTWAAYDGKLPQVPGCTRRIEGLIGERVDVMPSSCPPQLLHLASRPLQLAAQPGGALALQHQRPREGEVRARDIIRSPV